MIRAVTSLIVSVLLVSGFFMSVNTGVAYAYIDVGTGALLLQFVVAGFFGALFAVKIYWKRLTSLCNRLTSKKRTDNSNAK